MLGSENISVPLKETEVCEKSLKKIRIEQCKLLAEAASQGDYITLVKLLDAGVSVNAEHYTKSLFYASEYYVTPLQMASENNHLECVKELIYRGADVNCRDRFDVTAVHVAAEKGNVEVLRELLEAGAECNVPTKFSKRHSYTAVPHIGGTTPLHLAANRNHVECVKELIQCGADYNAIDEKGRTSLYIATQNGFSDCVLAHLYSVIGKDILSLPATDTGNTPLHFAVQNGMVECVEALLEAGSDPNHKNYAGSTPLHYAVYPTVPVKQESAEKILHLLVLQGHNVDVNLADNAGLTPLHYVCFSSGVRLSRRPTWAHFLIAYGAHVDIKTARGHSLIEVELKSHFEDHIILNACVQSLLHSPVLPLSLPEETPPLPPIPPPIPPTMAPLPPTLPLLPPPLPSLQMPQLQFHHIANHVFNFDDNTRANYLLSTDEINENCSAAQSEMVKEKHEWYMKQIARPMSLQHYCRYSIRQALGPKRLRYIKDLHAPNRMKDYLLLHGANY